MLGQVSVMLGQVRVMLGQIKVMLKQVKVMLGHDQNHNKEQGKKLSHTKSQ